MITHFDFERNLKTLGFRESYIIFFNIVNLYLIIYLSIVRFCQSRRAENLEKAFTVLVELIYEFEGLEYMALESVMTV